MPPRGEVLCEKAVGYKEPLYLIPGFEPLHAPLLLARQLMRVLCTGVETPRLAMFHPWQELTLGRSVALEFIGDNHARHIHEPFEQLAEESLRRLLISAALRQNVQYVVLLIYGPPEILSLAFDGETHLIHLPLIAGLGTTATQLVSILLLKLTAPLVDGLIRHDHSAF